MNKWTGIGNLTRDPELIFTQAGTAKCTFTLALNRPKRRGEDQGADYVRVVTWGKLAEICDRYLHKGSKAGVEGTIRTGSYEGKNGTVYTTDVWANEVEFLTQPAQRTEARPDPEKTLQDAKAILMPDDMPDSFQAADDDIPF